MTPEQQQHCEHECVCGVLMVGGTEGDKSPCDFSGCKHDTRSRPHQAPARTAEHMQSAYAHGVMDGERKAREDVLNAILDCAETDGDWFRIDGTDTLYLNYSVLSKKCESLRSTQQQAGDQHEQ